jgi:hypothetical protein
MTGFLVKWSTTNTKPDKEPIMPYHHFTTEERYVIHHNDSPCLNMRGKSLWPGKLKSFDQFTENIIFTIVI